MIHGLVPHFECCIKVNRSKTYSGHRSPILISSIRENSQAALRYFRTVLAFLYQIFQAVPVNTVICHFPLRTQQLLLALSRAPPKVAQTPPLHFRAIIRLKQSCIIGDQLAKALGGPVYCRIEEAVAPIEEAGEPAHALLSQTRILSTNVCAAP